MELKRLLEHYLLNTNYENKISSKNVVYLSIPIEEPNQYSVKWDKNISLGWSDKKPRVKFKPYTHSKKGGGQTLPCLLDYFRAAQLHLLVCAWKPGYESKMERECECFADKLQVNTFIGDSSRKNVLRVTNNPLIQSSIKAWRTYSAIKKYLMGYLWFRICIWYYTLFYRRENNELPGP